MYMSCTCSLSLSLSLLIVCVCVCVCVSLCVNTCMCVCVRNKVQSTLLCRNSYNVKLFGELLFVIHCSGGVAMQDSVRQVFLLISLDHLHTLEITIVKQLTVNPSLFISLQTDSQTQRL